LVHVLKVFFFSDRS